MLHLHFSSRCYSRDRFNSKYAGTFDMSIASIHSAFHFRLKLLVDDVNENGK